MGGINIGFTICYYSTRFHLTCTLQPRHQWFWPAAAPVAEVALSFFQNGILQFFAVDRSDEVKHSQTQFITGCLTISSTPEAPC